MEIKTITVLTAADGYVLTDGEAYGRTVYLGKGRAAEEFREIPEEEADLMQNAECIMQN